MKRMLQIALAANLLALALSWYTLPDRVALHFGMGGVPDRWGSRTEHLAVMGAVLALCAGLGMWPTWLLRRLPAKWLNIPHKEFWLREENMAEMYRRLEHILAEYGTALLCFFFALQMLIWQAHFAVPVHLHEPGFWAALAGLLVYTGVFVWRTHRNFRVP